MELFVIWNCLPDVVETVSIGGNVLVDIIGMSHQLMSFSWSQLSPPKCIPVHFADAYGNCHGRLRMIFKSCLYKFSCEERAVGRHFHVRNSHAYLQTFLYSLYWKVCESTFKRTSACLWIKSLCRNVHCFLCP